MDGVEGRDGNIGASMDYVPNFAGVIRGRGFASFDVGFQDVLFNSIAAMSMGWERGHSFLDDGFYVSLFQAFSLGFFWYFCRTVPGVEGNFRLLLPLCLHFQPHRIPWMPD